MTEPLTLMLAFGAGAALGGIFFGGLWWTVKKGLESSVPVLWFFSSLLLRTAIALLGFYFVSGLQWQRLLACFLGFFSARQVATALTRPAAESSISAAREVHRAP